MIERDLAHLRFLQTRVMKGETLDSSDMDFVQSKQAELTNILNNINEMTEMVRKIEEMR